MIDYSELTSEALLNRAESGDMGAVQEIERRGAARAQTPTPTPDFAAAAPAKVNVPPGHTMIRDVHLCTCGHPASEVRLDLNAHNMDSPFRCLVDSCGCTGFEYDRPFSQLDTGAVSAPITTGRFSPVGG